MTIAIFGADGQLGQDLQLALSSHEITAVLERDVDIAEEAQVKAAVSKARPDWVINSAAMTHVDLCESEDVKAFRVNALGARNVAVACHESGARLVHISTDYVFDGEKATPYVEADAARPLNAYGISKLSGELYVRARHAQHYIVRTSGLYGLHPCVGKGRNFVETMLELAKKNEVLRVVSDEVLTPTFTEDLAEQVRRLIEATPEPGVYHATNDGECSWHDFAAEIFRVAGTNVKLEKTTTAEWNAPATRPAYSVLANAALQQHGIDSMPHWKDALKRYLGKKLAG
jgi:dTDP-4-dehydrorhamnose reductase